MASQVEKARRFARLHEEGMLILPNAWDAGSAVIIAAAGAPAIATTSGGVAWSMGRPDGQDLTREQMIEQVKSIVRAVDLPVTADVEGGYGPGPEDVAATVEAAVAAGVVGVNIEDSKAPGGPLFSAAEQAARLKAGSAAAEAVGLPELVINARTDVFLYGIGKEEERLAEVIGRAEAYAEAGATSLFVPGLLDLAILEELVKSTPLPINAMAGPGAPPNTATSVPGSHVEKWGGSPSRSRIADPVSRFEGPISRRRLRPSRPPAPCVRTASACSRARSWRCASGA